MIATTETAILARLAAAIPASGNETTQ